VLIGRHGQTIDALQYLANAIGHRAHGPERLPILVDAAGYRARRAATLESLARRSAERVAATLPIASATSRLCSTQCRAASYSARARWACASVAAEAVCSVRFEIRTAGARQSKDCANLVRFLAYSGLRIGEVKFVTWADANFARHQLHVRGDPVTATTTRRAGSDRGRSASRRSAGRRAGTFRPCPAPRCRKRHGHRPPRPSRLPGKGSLAAGPGRPRRHCRSRRGCGPGSGRRRRTRS
jgi:integrase